MTTITLPIKCSTVKKANSLIDAVLDIELVLVSMAFVAWSLSFVYAWRFPDALSFILMYFGWIILIIISTVDGVFGKIWRALPSLACIKDEEDTS